MTDEELDQRLWSSKGQLRYDLADLEACAHIGLAGDEKMTEGVLERVTECMPIMIRLCTLLEMFAKAHIQDGDELGGAARYAFKALKVQP